MSTGAARVEKDVALADRTASRPARPGGEQRLADLVGELAVVAGEDRARGA
jgi:hypothetical protein